MPKRKPPAPQQPIQVKEKEGGVYSCYANSVNLTWTVYDLKVAFGELLKVSEDGTYIIEERAVVTMAWAEAKQLMEFLRQAVSRYEEVNGVIKILPELKTP